AGRHAAQARTAGAKDHQPGGWAPLYGGDHVNRFSSTASIIRVQERSIRGGALAHVEACQSDTSLQPCIRRADGPDHDASYASGARLRGGGTSLWFGLVPKGAQRCTTSSDEERRRRLGQLR